jgi:signal transduction histidine kinase/ActR/RegA family two-component response regulator
MRTARLRTKFLLSLLAISAGLTAATLFIVGYFVQRGVRASLQEDLQGSLSTYRNFAQQRESTLTRSAQLLANLPNVGALMSTRDPATIQDASEGVFALSGGDLLLLAAPNGTALALRSKAAGPRPADAEQLLQRSLARRDAQSWWFTDGQLYEVWIQPIHFGSTQTLLGFLAIGQAIDQVVARDLSTVAASEVAFRYNDSLVASTLPAAQTAEAMRRLPAQLLSGAADHPQEMVLDSERYLAATVRLSQPDDAPVFLSVFKSFDKASAFLRQLNSILAGLGLLSVLAGSALVFLISDTFTRPLANLVAGVRALETGDYDYPLEQTGGDEVAEVTGAFTRMRAGMRKAKTERERLEAQLRQAHKMEAVGRLAGGVAHDFNNLLTIIRGHSDLLLERPDNDTSVKRSVEQIRKAADRAVALTRQLLAFSRMQVLQPRVLDLNAVVADLGKMLPRLIGEHIEYVFRPGANLGRVKADPGQIEQVIMNLVVNARDAMPEGGALTLATRNVMISEAEASRRAPMSAGSYVLLSVADTGHGMDEATKSHIFEPFFTTKEVGKGTGLGLATVYGVVKQSGGYVWVESTPGHGATFEVYLPLCAQEARSETESAPATIPRGSETILVVEDEDDVRSITSEFLTSSGYSVLEAANGADALEVIARYKGRIDLVLSDMVMPKMSGTALAERLKIILPDTVMILISGYAEYSAAARDSGVKPATVLQKPLSRGSLVAKVREALEDSAVRRRGVLPQQAVT